MHIKRISFVLCIFIAFSASLAWAASVISTATTTTTATSTTTYPSLIECVCNTTLASAAVVKTSTTSSSTQTQKYVLPGCLEDVFAETGIRWYLNGPMLPGVTYWQDGPPKDYSSGRAAQRLIRLGYRCSRVQLYDSSDPYY
ncbi:hypothetical protein DVH05_012028 [Phytophthora capsici]|nr:hypothetical protein DVH05_012028 [Phytophthora capsici]|eukprot:jgi/Phyca11/539931/estExt2_Genewise1Plus.C_PHYCAscaffold_40234